MGNQQPSRFGDEAEGSEIIEGLSPPMGKNQPQRISNDKSVEANGERSRWLVRDRSYRKLHLTKDTLEDLYLRQKLSTVEIAKRLHMGRNTLIEHMEMHDIPRRTPGVAGAMKSRIHFINQDYFVRLDSDEKAYIAGFILADGGLYDRGKSKRLEIGVAESDGDLLEAIAERLGDKSLVRRRPAAIPTEQTKVILKADSTKLVNDLLAAGLPLSPKSGKEPFLRLETPRLTWSLIRGAFDGDGCVRVYDRMTCHNGKEYGPYRKCRWSITIGHPFILGLVEFFRSQGVALSPKCVQPKQGTSLLEVSNPTSIRMIRDQMYYQATIWLARKKALLDMV